MPQTKWCSRLTWVAQIICLSVRSKNNFNRFQSRRGNRCMFGVKPWSQDRVIHHLNLKKELSRIAQNCVGTTAG